MVREVLQYSKERLRMEPELKHLKRVCRRRDADGKSESAFLCLTSITSPS